MEPERLECQVRADPERDEARNPELADAVAEQRQPARRRTAEVRSDTLI
jgi:hypothetical protein